MHLEVSSTQVDALHGWVLIYHLLLWQDVLTWFQWDALCGRPWFIALMIVLLLGLIFSPWRCRRLLNQIRSPLVLRWQSSDCAGPADAIGMDHQRLIAVPGTSEPYALCPSSGMLDLFSPLCLLSFQHREQDTLTEARYRLS